ncbi:universal stress protein [Blastococcus sp. MG754426]|uniref:universal stress protein n=1 Tax=unclassified Blastococcus TaxID=2619396 RepID=UPI001EEFFCEC|nr:MULTISPECIES: universal stress protein [unclassified Blastococcus]MCF6509379.1 universal stress protein [Blastococcus sp. MG754426]MCF6513633.1 universal stress protein [Blastococcus sp. MG754427]MCF6736724.1 universal stress protein [Blastococcus sp. KM273129]
MPESILVGLDGSEASGRAADAAADAARRHGLRLVLACVVPWSPYSFTTAEENERRPVEKEREAASARERVLDPVVARLSEPGDLVIEGVVRHGHPAETLVRLAREHDAAWITVGRIGQSRVRTLLFGSTPTSLIQLSPVPVLVVP